MKVTYNWLKDFVDIKIPAAVLAKKLTMAGLEVVSLEEKAGDWVFEIEITSNRPDWLSVMGIAREVAAITNSRLKIKNEILKIKSQITKSPTKLEIKVESKEDCPLYTARIIKDVQVKASPDWMRQRLELVGIRPVNNIVDITNYVLLETGEPLHAFDLDKLMQEDGLQIFIRRARPNEKIITIDAKERILDKDILVIADSRRPIAVAGLMGGKDTEVTEDTKNILLEAAKFSPPLIRKARQKLGVNTESSYRFERDVDIGIVDFASQRAQRLIQEETGAPEVLFKSQPKTIPLKKTKAIRLRTKKISAVLGFEIPFTKTKKILQDLGLKVKTKGKDLNVFIPSFRRDLNKEIDLIEEICRIHGYDFISSTRPSTIAQDIERSVFDLNFLIRDILLSQGLNEVITYSLISQDLLKKCGLDETAIFLANPLSKEVEILRPTLIPSLLTVIAHNLNHRQDLIQIFEIAKRFKVPQKEEYFLAVGLCGIKVRLTSAGRQEEKMSLLHLKGILEILFERLGIRDFGFTPTSHSTFCEGRAFSINIEDKKIGMMGEIKPEILAAFDIKNQE
ncbi:MAG: phenylalanine--tRNA ligase subunit beta, partial [Candidatus Omnitrophica bacterium]|nr:phenylalanine--tRNA ligase subunit beta [Candidatus Omnitrophota bacterium]